MTSRTPLPVWTDPPAPRACDHPLGSFDDPALSALAAELWSWLLDALAERGRIHAVSELITALTHALEQAPVARKEPRLLARFTGVSPELPRDALVRAVVVRGLIERHRAQVPHEQATFEVTGGLLIVLGGRA